MKIAIVHDYLSQDGGAERVLEALLEMWPEAPLYTLFYDEQKFGARYTNTIKTSFLQNTPLAKKHYQWFLPFMPLATESYDLSSFDIIISSTSAFAKGIITKPNAMHICYCHTPTRYLWTDAHSYIEDLPYPWIIKKTLPTLFTKLRQWDFISAQRVNYFIANSQTVADRIQHYYNKPSHIIYPPADMPNSTHTQKRKYYFVTGGRLVPYKRFDIVIRACSRLGLPLTVFGDGPIQSSLKTIAGPTITFTGRISDEEKNNLYKHAQAFIHPQIEDAGITPLEAMAHGTPVIAFNKGGATETIINKQTGIFFNNQRWENLAHSLLEFKKYTFNHALIAKHAQKYSTYQFKKTVRNFVEQKYRQTHANRPDLVLTSPKSQPIHLHNKEVQHAWNLK